MKIYKLVVLLLLCIVCSIPKTTFSQCPTDDIIIRNQDQIDSFVILYPMCTQLKGGLIIQNLIFFPIITSLEGLSAINSVNGDLSILSNNYLVDLAGLENVSSISGQLTISGNDRLETTLEDMASLSNVEGNVSIQNNNVLRNIEGPTTLKKIRLLEIFYHDSLQTISGFSGLTDAEFGIHVLANPKLTAISGFDILRNVGNKIDFSDNELLTVLDGFGALRKCDGNILIDGPSQINTLSAFHNLEVVAGDLGIFRQTNSMINITGLSNLDSVTGNLFIRYNEPIKDLSFLANASYVKFLQINDNPGLESLNGIQNISGDNNWFSITGNDNLEDCSAICPLISRYGIAGSWINMDNTLLPCMSFEAAADLCEFKVSGFVKDIGIDLDMGIEQEAGLIDAVVDLYYGQNWVESTVTDAAGYFEFDTIPTETDSLYRMEFSHPSHNELKVIHELQLVNLFDQNLIGFPLATVLELEILLDTLERYLFEISFNDGSEFAFIENTYDLADFKDVVEVNYMIADNHEYVRLSLKLQTLGAHWMKQYLVKLGEIVNLLSSSIFESSISVYNLTNLLTSEESLKNDLTQFIINQTIAGNYLEDGNARIASIYALSNASQTLLNIIENQAYSSYVTRSNQSVSEIDFARSMRSLLEQVSLKIRETATSGTIDPTYQNDIVNLMVIKLIRSYATTTQDYLFDILDESAEQSNNFNEAYSNSAMRWQESQTLDNRAIQRALELGASADKLEMMANKLADLRDRINSQSNDALHEIALPLKEAARNLRVKGLFTDARVFVEYAERFGKYPAELSGAIDQISMRNSSAEYSDGFFDDQLIELGHYFMNTTNLIRAFQMELLNPVVENVATAYINLEGPSSFGNTLDRQRHYLNATVESGFNQDTMLPAYALTNKILHELDVRKSVIDLMTLAYFLDTTSLEITNDLYAELDTFVMLQDAFHSQLVQTYAIASDQTFEPMVAVSTLTYPDSLLGDNFNVQLVIENFGPAATDSFWMDLVPSDNMMISQINGQSPSLPIRMAGLAADGTSSFDIQFDLINAKDVTDLSVTFDGIRAVDEYIPIDFINVIQYTSTRGVADKKDEEMISVSPNPTSDPLHIELTIQNNETLYEVLDMQGHVVLTSFDNDIAVAHLPSGLYFVRCTVDSKVYYANWVKM